MHARQAYGGDGSEDEDGDASWRGEAEKPTSDSAASQVPNQAGGETSARRQVAGKGARGKKRRAGGSSNAGGGDGNDGSGDYRSRLKHSVKQRHVSHWRGCYLARARVSSAYLDPTRYASHYEWFTRVRACAGDELVGPEAAGTCTWPGGASRTAGARASRQDHPGQAAAAAGGADDHRLRRRGDGTRQH